MHYVLVVDLQHFFARPRRLWRLKWQHVVKKPSTSRPWCGSWSRRWSPAGPRPAGCDVNWVATRPSASSSPSGQSSSSRRPQTHPSSCAGYVVVCAMLVDGWGMYIYCEDRKNCQLRRICGCLCHISSCAVESVPDWSGHQRDCEERKECNSCAGYVGCAMLLLICFGINASLICGIHIIVKEEGNCLSVCLPLLVHLLSHLFFSICSNEIGTFCLFGQW